jgi:hypothetical protein
MFTPRNARSLLPQPHKGHKDDAPSKPTDQPVPKPAQAAHAPLPAAPVATGGTGGVDVKKPQQIKRKRGWDMSRTGVPAGAPAANAHAQPSAPQTRTTAAVAKNLPGPSGPPLATAAARPSTVAATPTISATPAVAAPAAPAAPVVSPGQGWEAEVAPAPAQLDKGGLRGQGSLHSVPSLEYNFTSIGLVCRPAAYIGNISLPGLQLLLCASLVTQDLFLKLLDQVLRSSHPHTLQRVAACA